jgi:hypothetical protein
MSRRESESHDARDARVLRYARNFVGSGTLGLGLWTIGEALSSNRKISETLFLAGFTIISGIGTGLCERARREIVSGKNQLRR